MTSPQKVHSIAAAWKRMEAAFRRRPSAGLHDDAPATARWDGGTRFIAHHAGGATFASDMPQDLGGGGADVTPGWMLRAGLANCLGTCIAMRAAAQDIELTKLDVTVGSRSDTRGLLGLPDAAGAAVGAGPRDMQIAVRIAANNATADRLRELVDTSNQYSPISCAVRDAVPIDLRVEIVNS